MGAPQPAPTPLTDEALRAALSSLPQGLVIVNEHREAVYANRLAQDLLGGALELGRPVPWPVSGPDAGFVPAALGGSLRARSLALDGLDGLALVVLVAAARTEPSHIRSGADEILKEVEAIAQLGSWAWEVGDEAIDWSDGLYRLYGLEPQSIPITFESFVAMTPPEIRDRIVETIKRCTETGDGYTFTTVPPARWRHSRANTVTTDGRVSRMFGTTQDVTEEMLTEHVLRESAEQADRLARENEALRAEVEAQLWEVRASRSRIVQAADDARRRLERDLRDGAQQRLAAVGSNLRSARAGLDPAVKPDLARARAGDRGVGPGRRRAAVARPWFASGDPDRRGVGCSAPGVLASRSGVAVRLRADSLGALPPAVESAAYFVVSEALTNVVKHAHASQAHVSLERTPGSVLVEVSDDGRGGATFEQGTGLRGLSDRVAALGGRLRLDSPVRGGTLLRAELPLGDEPSRG